MSDLDVAWIEVSGSPEAPLVRIGGDLTVRSLPDIQPRLMTSIETADAVTIDLEELKLCDSGGIGMFIAAQGKADAYGTKLALTHVRPAVRRLFRVTGLEGRFQLSD
jgi:anti-sigma B factor antagonist